MDKSWQLLFTLPGFPGGSESKESACSQQTWVWSLGLEEPLEKEMATHSSILAWTEKRSELQPMGCSPPGSSVHGILQARILECGNHVGFLELRRDSRVTTGISACPLGWPWEAQSSPRVARESWGLRSSHCRGALASARDCDG